MLLRLTYLGVMNAFALLRLLPMSGHDKDTEILVLRHQITVLQRQLAPHKARFNAADRAFLAALLHRLPRPTLRSLRLLVLRVPESTSAQVNSHRRVSFTLRHDRLRRPPGSTGPDHAG